MKVGYMATLKVADGKQADFEAAFAEMQKAVAADEPGTLQYDLMQDEASSCIKSYCSVPGSSAATAFCISAKAASKSACLPSATFKVAIYPTFIISLPSLFVFILCRPLLQHGRHCF